MTTLGPSSSKLNPGQLELFRARETREVLGRPAGIVELEGPVGDGATYLEDAGSEDKLVVMGWYYGYPACCVRWFATRWTRVPSDIPAYEAADHLENHGKHPVSGHLLCPECAAGEPEPLPDRPATRYGWAQQDAEGRLLFDAPHDYD